MFSFSNKSSERSAKRIIYTSMITGASISLLIGIFSYFDAKRNNKDFIDLWMNRAVKFFIITLIFALCLLIFAGFLYYHEQKMVKLKNV